MLNLILFVCLSYVELGVDVLAMLNLILYVALVVLIMLNLIFISFTIKALILIIHIGSLDMFELVWILEGDLNSLLNHIEL